ncbi:MAG TPA: BON domain-containing protein [Rhodocyclaceae bacterium]
MQGQDGILKQVAAAIEHEAGVEMQNGPIAVHWADGSIVLDGEVPDVRTKKLAVGAAAAAAGAEAAIVDRLRLGAGMPVGDGETRDAVCRWLLRDIDFQNCGVYALVKDRHETLREPGMDASGEIEVAVADGVVSLTGHVMSLSHKRLAGVLAWWARGCRDVVNLLAVMPGEDDNDEEIAEALKLVLETDPFVHADQIGVGARDSVVTLKGQVWSEGERERAEQDAWCIFAVKRVVNQLEVLPA